jgi:hypothetical protein
MDINNNNNKNNTNDISLKVFENKLFKEKLLNNKSIKLENNFNNNYNKEIKYDKENKENEENKESNKFKDRVEFLFKKSKLYNNNLMEKIFVDYLNKNDDNESMEKVKKEETVKINTNENKMEIDIDIDLDKNKNINKNNNMDIDIDMNIDMDLEKNFEKVSNDNNNSSHENLTIEFKQNLLLKNSLNNSSIKNLLFKLKENFVGLNTEIINIISQDIYLENFLSIKNLEKNSIKKICWMEENPNYFPYSNIMNKENKSHIVIEKLLYIWYYDNNLSTNCIILLHFIYSISNKKISKNMKINQKNLKVEKISYIKFPLNYGNISILDFCLHQNKNLIFLVKLNEDKNIIQKENINIQPLLDQNQNQSQNQNQNNINNSNIKNNSNNNNYLKDRNSSIGISASNLRGVNNNNTNRFSLIYSEIINYKFEAYEILKNKNIDNIDSTMNNHNSSSCNDDINNNTNDDLPIFIDINLMEKVDLIKIDKLIDLDCSENSYISPGKRNFVSIIDNKKNKMTIVDLS